MDRDRRDEMVRDRSEESKQRGYERLSARMALNLAAPHTWPASVMPALIGICLAVKASPISVTMALAVLAISVLMQSSVNTFNDYFDYVKGTDDESADVDVDDSVLVYNNVNPRSALFLAIGFLSVAFLLGVYIIMNAGFAPLVIALIGAVFVVLYSAGRTPVSYLPIGELVSGFVMGCLIPLGAVVSLTGTLDLTVLALSIPTFIGVALIMLTNNTCDIERDIDAGRRTFPVVVGRQNAVATYRLAVIVWIVAIIACTALCFQPGLIVVPFMVLAAIPLVKAVFGNTFEPNRRTQCMPQKLSLNIVFGAFYAAAILASTVPVLVF